MDNVIKFIAHVGSRMAYGVEIVSSGKYEWSILPKFPETSCQLIGISSDCTGIDSHNSRPICLSWCNGCKAIQGDVGQGWHEPVEITPHESWKSADIITIKLDLDRQTLAWYTNKDSLPVATCKNVPKSRYKLAIHGYQTD